LRRTRELAVLLITHDLGVVAEVAERVAVMYTGKDRRGIAGGRIVCASKTSLHRRFVEIGAKLTAKDVIKAERLQTIEGTVPRPTALPPGCHFEPRCHFRMPRCREAKIPLYDVMPGVQVRCVLFDPATNQERIETRRSIGSDRGSAA